MGPSLAPSAQFSGERRTVSVSSVAWAQYLEVLGLGWLGAELGLLIGTRGDHMAAVWQCACAAHLAQRVLRQCACHTVLVCGPWCWHRSLVAPVPLSVHVAALTDKK